MALVHRLCEGVKGELDLFSLPTTQKSIEDGQWLEHRPTASLGEGGSIEFLLSGSGVDYLYFASAYLYTRTGVVKADGTNIEKDSPVGLLNNWLHSLFSHVDVSLNDTFVTP